MFKENGRHKPAEPKEVASVRNKERLVRCTVCGCVNKVVAVFGVYPSCNDCGVELAESDSYD